MARALSALTFALGRRFVIADGVERWKETDAEPVADALRGLDPDSLTVAFFGREEGRHKVPATLRKAVEAAGGQIAEEARSGRASSRAGSIARAGELELTLDTQAARALIAQTGDRQQRLLRELEKLALEHGTGARLGVEEIEASSASSAERKAWTLADAVCGGRRADGVARTPRAARAGRARAGAAVRGRAPPPRGADRRRGACGGPAAPRRCARRCACPRSPRTG